jgi:hypothetical protein
MLEISRYVHQDKQEKNWDVDCTCSYNPYGHVEGHTIMMMWQVGDMVHFHWTVVGKCGVDVCH